MNKTTVKCIFVFVLFVLINGFSVKSADAAIQGSEFKKAVATSIIQCYQHPGVFKSPITLGDYNNTWGFGWGGGFMNDGPEVGLPNGAFNKNSAKCSEFMKIVGDFVGVSVPKKEAGSEAEQGKFLVSMGYEEQKDSAVSSGKCMEFKFDHYVADMNVLDWDSSSKLESTVTTQKICAEKIDSNGVIQTDKMIIENGNTSVVSFGSRKNAVSITIKRGTFDNPTETIKFEKGKTTWESLKKNVRDIILDKASEKNTTDVNASIFNTYRSDRYVMQLADDVAPLVSDYGSVKATYTLKSNAASIATETFLGESYSSIPSFTEQEQFSLYQYYLTNFYNADIMCNELSENEIKAYTGENKGYKAIKYYSKGQMQQCYAKPKNHSKDKVNGIQNGIFGLKNCDFACLADWLNNSNVTELPEDAGAIEPENVEEQDSCANAGGAESLGWIVCPILEWMQKASQDMYSNYIEDALSVDPRLFSEKEGNNNDAKDAWSVFRDFSNILFVILLIVVIFSQLTGVGIDNYGVKKILPKLILAAVMINLSYYICVIAVDISNIVGNGVQSLFDAMSSNISFSNGSSEIGDLNAIASTGVSAVGILGGVAALGLVVWTNPAVLLTLLVAALGVVVAIFFLFILLVGREAGIVMLTVISPLAFACLMLPNTKNLFSKWLKMSQGLLLLYPICGLLVGGGNYLSRLIMFVGVSGEGFFGAFAAMAIGIVPIFFIPSLLKSSFAAMGNIGAKISGVGKSISSGSQRAIRNSEGYKNMQQAGLERKTRIKAGYDANGNKKKLGTFGTLMRGGTRSVQRNALRYQKNVAERGSLEATEGENFMLATDAANELKRIQSTGEINRISTLEEGLESAMNSGNRAKIVAYQDALYGKGEDGRRAAEKVYNSYVGTGKRANDKSAVTFANNIMNNHAADIKKNNRSMFEVAKEASNGGNAMNTNGFSESFRPYLMTKSTAESLSSMDKDEYARTFGDSVAVSRIIGGMSDEEKNALGEAAFNASQNDSTKQDRKAELERLVAATGYKPKPIEVRQVTP